ncbi:GPN-loop GTPase 3-like [Tropilaelaps mercedesae]|uniref:GPN-loop GTPase 3 n=1 Tax=Tropilaelaps mercedesae TaxID=418985 RepID=A0A1V9XDH2_9ACAR|nr:GPN-loop GTPase 3-like [Tropilaelaps mercedesae]
MRFAQLVMGPAGAGKSTFCSSVARHAEVAKRIVNLVNLDPACEYFDYSPVLDVRDLIHVDDVMEDEELRLGPNGGLIFCLEYLIRNPSWLTEQLIDTPDDEYFIFDCPGQIELYTHLDVMKRFSEMLVGLDFRQVENAFMLKPLRVCGVYLIEAQFMVDTHKFFSGVLSALSCMVNLELPFVCILSKMDLLNSAGRRKIADFVDSSAQALLDDSREAQLNPRFEALSRALARVVDDFSLVRFVPLNIRNEESIADALMFIDNAIQYGEDLDVKTAEFEYPDPDDC